MQFCCWINMYSVLLNVFLKFLHLISSGSFACKILLKYKKWFTLIRTSWALGGATSTSSMEKGLFFSHSTAALHFITWKVKQKDDAISPSLRAGIVILLNLHVVSGLMFES